MPFLSNYQRSATKKGSIHNFVIFYRSRKINNKYFDLIFAPMYEGRREKEISILKAAVINGNITELTMCKAIIIGDHFSVKLLKGSTFYISMPITQAH